MIFIAAPQGALGGNGKKASVALKEFGGWRQKL
jgi:hypothetical protein